MTTTRWQITPDWQGETAVLVGHADSMTKELADWAMTTGYRIVAVNQAVRFVPKADLFVALDPHPSFWASVEGFPGLKVIGVDVEMEGHDALYAGMFYETVRMPDGSMVEIRNNFIAAMRVAERLGCAKLILMGVDAEAYEERHRHTGFFGFVQALPQVSDDLRAKGIEVVTINSMREVLA